MWSIKSFIKHRRRLGNQRVILGNEGPKEGRSGNTIEDMELRVVAKKPEAFGPLSFRNGSCFCKHLWGLGYSPDCELWAYTETGKTFWIHSSNGDEEGLKTSIPPTPLRLQPSGPNPKWLTCSAHSADRWCQAGTHTVTVDVTLSVGGTQKRGSHT